YRSLSPPLPPGGRERLATPLDEPSYAVWQLRLRPESEQLLRSPRVTVAARRKGSRRPRLVFDPDPCASHFEDELREVAHASLDAAADVDDSVGRTALAGEQVRAHDVADIYEVDRVAAV